MVTNCSKYILSNKYDSLLFLFFCVCVFLNHAALYSLNIACNYHLPTNLFESFTAIFTLTGLSLDLSITNGIVSSKIYDKHDAFSFEIVNFPFIDGGVPRSPSYFVHIW